MDLTALPFNVKIGLSRAGGALSLPADPSLGNHLGTLHAGAQFALAEAASGQWLLDAFPASLAARVVPVLRRAEVKYSAPAKGAVVAEAEAAPGEAERIGAELEARGRTTARIKVVVRDSGGNRAMSGEYEWFLRMAGEGAE